jgi:hypothetical protein
MDYNIVVPAKNNEITIGMTYECKVIESGTRVKVAVFGSPRVTEGCAIVEVVVRINPEASVMTKVAMS